MKRYETPAISRRQFLKAAASGTILLLVGCRPGQTNGIAQVVPDSDGAAASPSSATPTRRPREIEITPVGAFYRQQFQSVADVDAATWTLTVDGLVDRPGTFTLDTLRGRPRAELMRTLECIGNPVGGNQIGNAVWAGFWLDELLAEVGVRPEAVRARFEAEDGYETSAARSFIDRPGVLMAYEMNGAPLMPEHGYPLRILMPGLYGQKMPKWISRIEFIDDNDHRGYWEQKGWSEEATVKTNSQIMQPTHIGAVPMAEIEVFGVAYAGDRTITSVEVGVESGNELTWYPAELLAGASNQVWTQFYLAWTPPSATSYTLLVRATDEQGFVQTERASGILQGAYPDGTDKIHSIVIRAG